MFISSFRRLKSIWELTTSPGSKIVCAIKNSNPRICVGGGSIGPLHGLPATDGIGEIRDLVVDEPYRSKGLGRKIFHQCLEEAKRFGYKRIYLETTPEMHHAINLFERFQFQAIKHQFADQQAEDTETSNHELPCYYILDHLSLKGSV